MKKPLAPMVWKVHGISSPGSMQQEPMMRRRQPTAPQRDAFSFGNAVQHCLNLRDLHTLSAQVATVTHTPISMQHDIDMPMRKKYLSGEPLAQCVMSGSHSGVCFNNTLEVM
mmetsp:Transcript_10268/g.29074  ORF Transcript_10268/g.29074 Transcript_10268/m.29074 type:complete len:112 (-) Transcript_10268:301-636(-)